MQAKGKTVPFGPAQFINRELSWLEFNQRVLEEALDPENPLLERLKFFCIVSSNLDEFFEVRVAGLKQQVESDVVERSMDGLTASEVLRAITRRVRRMIADQYACWREQLQPALTQNGIRILDLADLEPADLAWLQQYYRDQVRPVLTPLAIDPAHPFPQLLNKSLNLIVRLEMPRHQESLKHLAVVQIPRILPRMVKLPRKDGRQDCMLSVFEHLPYVDIIGSTPEVSTSASCSIQPMMCDSSPAILSCSLSGNLIRARVAMCATVALSSAMM